jgi:tRNA nucleotidyltransferase (CCA-adding enzyme)
VNKINHNAKFICEKLHDAEFYAYIVGGAVRDMIRKVEPKDWDICTNATVDQLHEVFKGFQIHNVGAAFGVCTVIINGEPFEIAQMREDIGGNDNRHPQSVAAVSNIVTDLNRRDFTINAIAYDPTYNVFIDSLEGEKDIKNKIIKFVGNPQKRIEEDNLRILRAFRFASQFDYEFSSETFTAILNFFYDGGDFSKISAERITAEFIKILTGKAAFKIIHLMAVHDILDYIIPEIAEMRMPHNSYYHTEEMLPFGNSILAHTLFVFKYACEKTDKLQIRLAALLHDIGKNRCRETKQDGTDRFLFHDKMSAKMTEEILTARKFDRQTINEVVALVEDHMNMHNIVKMSNIAKIRRLLGKKNFNDLYILGIADTLGTSGNNKVPNYEDAEILTNCINKYVSQFPVMLPEPFIRGDDLIVAGKRPGPEFSHALKVAYDQQLRGATDKKKVLNHALGTMN